MLRLWSAEAMGADGISIALLTFRSFEHNNGWLSIVMSQLEEEQT
jgi:hypothetical protein